MWIQVLKLLKLKIKNLNKNIQDLWHLKDNLIKTNKINTNSNIKINNFNKIIKILIKINIDNRIRMIKEINSSINSSINSLNNLNKTNKINKIIKVYLQFKITKITI